jgi:hypothetical protein
MSASVRAQLGLPSPRLGPSAGDVLRGDSTRHVRVEQLRAGSTNRCH